ncbi:MAG: hypothetical protein ACF8R7_18810 [Phycisphaerales bacterium JB039]
MRVQPCPIRTLASAAALALFAGAAAAQPGAPAFGVHFDDCVTGDNEFRSGGSLWWDVDPGCDIYQQDLYERPLTQEFQFVDMRYAAKEYFEYLDIERISAGFDFDYLYVAIDLYGRDNVTSDGSRIEVGMAERYGFRISADPDGRNGILLVSDQPELKTSPPTRWGTTGVFGYRDTDGDVGGAADSGPTGLLVTKTDNPDEEDGLNGYDQVFISDGRLDSGPTVLWTRLRPGDDTVVEFALDYKAVGFTIDDLRRLGYFDLEAVKGGPKDPQNYLWNDKYTGEEAGSPNPGPGGLSEFGTQGLENIYELDTVRAGPIVDAGCYADCDGNGALDFFDFLCFQSAFAAGDFYADCDASGALDFFDFLCFQNRFDVGCP